LSGCQNNDLLSNQAGNLSIQFGQSQCKTGLMLRQLRVLSILPFRFFCSRRDLVLENLALRQQLKVLTRRRPAAAVFSTRPIVLGDVATVLLRMEAGIEWWVLKSKQVRPAPTAHLRTSE
jgi:hypothetical protein